MIEITVPQVVASVDDNVCIGTMVVIQDDESEDSGQLLYAGPICPSTKVVRAGVPIMVILNSKDWESLRDFSEMKEREKGAATQ